MKIFNDDFRSYIKQMNHKNVVFIDPPWSYDDRIMTKTQLKYSLWEDNDKELDFIFENLKADHIFMWVTNSFLQNVMRSDHYDFVYKTLVTWVKRYKSGKLFYGKGSSFRNCTEHLAVFTRIDTNPIQLDDRTVIFFPPTQRTQKPTNWEYELLKKIEEKHNFKKFAYIFSGLNTTYWYDMNIDLVDKELDNNSRMINQIQTTYFSF